MKHIPYVVLGFITVAFLTSACGKDRLSPLKPINTSASTSPSALLLPSYTVTGIVLDAKDLAWIGTKEALATYDGTNTRHFRPTGQEGSLPSDNIRCLFGDHDQRVWIGTALGLCTYSRYSSFKQYPDVEGQPVPVTQITETSDRLLIVQSGQEYYSLGADDKLQPLPSLRQTDGPDNRMVPDEDGGLWIITPSAAVHYNRSFEPTTRHTVSGQKTANLDAVRIRDMLWTLQGMRLSCLDLRSGELRYTEQIREEYPITFLFYDGSRLLLKSRRYGLQAYDPNGRRFIETNLPNIPTTPSRAEITHMSTDRLGNLWIGYEHYGVMCISVLQQRIEEQNASLMHLLTRGEYVTSLKTDGNGNLWGSFGQKVFHSSPSGDSVQLYEVSDLLGKDSQVCVVDSDGEDHLWLAGFNKIGVTTLSGSRLGPVKTRYLHFRPGNTAALDGHCFITTDTPYLYVVDKNGALDSLSIDSTTAAYYDREARILPIGESELIVFCNGLACSLVNPGRRTVEPFRVKNEDFSNLDNVADAVLDGQIVWFSMNRGGLYSLNLRTGDIEKDPAFSGISIAGIVKYSDRRMLLETGNGVFYYDPETHDARYFGLMLGGKEVTAFTPGGSVKGTNSIILTSNNGCVTVPADIPLTADRHNVTVHRVTALDSKGSFLVRMPPDESHIELKHRHNSIEITYGPVCYDKQPVTIRYKLEGNDLNWKQSTREMVASYSKLPTGKYTFRLQELQPFTDKVLDEHELLIRIRPAVMWSWPTILLYLLVFALIAWGIIKSRIKARADRERVRIAEQKNELEHRTNEMNMSFFANIAHEFRNPLTVISGPLETLLHDDSLPEGTHKKLHAISSSANSMLRLIDQMLDFNQLEMDVLKLCVGEHDICYEISRLAGVFEEGAGPRGIRINARRLDDPFITLVDLDKMEKILYNLFTNALKHTPDEGAIGIIFDEITGDEARAEFGQPDLAYSRYFKVDITNNGPRIEESRLPDVFKRYFQSSETSRHHDYGWGRGIGLYFVQRLVQVHHGSIRVFNLPDGVCFSFVIPTDPEAYADADREDERIHRILQIDIPKDRTKEQPAEGLIDDRPVLLVVDDDIQVGQYLRSMFEGQYKVVNRYSAEAALKDIESVDPDLIISDVVMGKMSGYDLCREIKTNMMFSHIPIILLTAKTDIEDSVSGLESGATAYVTKPFSAEYLTALVGSQLKNVERIRQSLNRATEVSLVDGELSEQDRNFIKELYEIMDRHLPEATLNIPTVCEELRISRTKFNYKLKGLTGTTPGAFFRHYKLNLAAKMLKEGKHNVTEISDKLGFNSVSNFSATFKKKFGVSPKDYK